MRKNKRRVAKIVIATSILLRISNGSGCITAVKPSIQNILKILLPTTFPIAISACFLSAATTEVASSGRLVPIATTVNPIIASLIPIFVARSTAPSTIHFPQRVNPTKPSNMNMMDFHVG